jgi:predicted phosphodiesterase
LRLLLLSDIHSNLEALEACLGAAPPHDAVANLGDIVGYGASPNEVTSRVREMGGTFVRGNHDKVVAGLEDVESFNPIAGLAALWNRGQMTGENMEWLRTLPQGPVAIPGLDGIQLVHGAPRDEDQYVVSIEEALQPLVESGASLTFFGHTHVQGTFVLRAGFGETLHPAYSSIGQTETCNFQLETGANYMINPGSVGQPRDGDWRAAFSVFDSDRRIVTFCRAPYDVRAAQERILAANLPQRLATRLAAGR